MSRAHFCNKHWCNTLPTLKISLSRSCSNLVMLQQTFCANLAVNALLSYVAWRINSSTPSHWSVSVFINNDLTVFLCHLSYIWFTYVKHLLYKITAIFLSLDKPVFFVLLGKIYEHIYTWYKLLASSQWSFSFHFVSHLCAANSFLFLCVLFRLCSS